MTAIDVIIAGLDPTVDRKIDMMKEMNRRDASHGFTWIKCNHCRKWFVDIKNLECPHCKERR